MSRKNRRQNRPQALNAIRPPQAQMATVQPIELTETQKIAVNAVVNNERILQQQRQEFMQNQAEVLRQKGALISEIEQHFKIAQGAIERGEYALIDGHLICQKPQQAEREQQRTGTEG